MPQSATLLDRHERPLRDLRISVTDRCNLRCRYCMPEGEGMPSYAGAPRDTLLTFEEIARVARAAAALGVRKLRVTGGEPLLRKGLPALVALLAEIPGIEDIALTTNGLLLPRMAEELKAAGLMRVTVSLDTLDDAVFARLTSRDNRVAEVLAGIDAAVSAGLLPVKVNAVILRGVNDDAVVALAERFRHTGIAMRFIEYMDVGNLNAWRREDVVRSAELIQRISALYALEALEPAAPGEVAQRYRFRDGGGEVGFISSISQPFCGDCNRLRLSPTGDLFTCLFAATGHPLRDLLRSAADDAALRDAIARVWRARTDRYSEERFRPGGPAPARKVEMHHIGG